jgi:hypothetical protein
MSKLLIVPEAEGEGWQVWITVENTKPYWPYGLIIGRGATRDQAVAEAVQDLEARLEELQAPLV